MTDENCRVIGIWDKKSAGLGSFIIFLSELLQIKRSLNAKALVVRISDPREVLSTFAAMLTDVDSVQAHMGPKMSPGDFIWPESSEYSHDTTLFLQKQFRDSGSLVPLIFKQEVVQRIHKDLKSNSDKAICVLHLKQHAHQMDSNATISQWKAFVESRPDIYFYPIGNEPLPSDFLTLKNVNPTFLLEHSLLDQLIAIAAADGFMGMSSGPCNVAITCPRPYLVIKHPDHHKAEMQQEIGSADRFPFAWKNQFIVRQYETAELLSNYANKLFC